MTVENKGKITLKADEKQIIKDFVDLMDRITDELVDDVYYTICDGDTEFSTNELNDIYFGTLDILKQFDERY